MLTELQLSESYFLGAQHDKRWFQDSYFDLFVWQDKNTGHVVCFQLCYDRLGRERVLCWDKKRGFEHHIIDDGEESPHKNMTPIFTQTSFFDYNRVIPHFRQASEKIAPTISFFILQRLAEYQQHTESIQNQDITD